jgi:8-oxo-dGTP pyrophosphatase MutT (NUDIX family)
VLSFNPRSVPVLSSFQPSPAVSHDRLTASAVRKRWLQTRPWQPEIVREKQWGTRPPAAAAVLIPLIEAPSGLQVLLTLRTTHLSSHAGQVAFPGGRIDAQDPHPQATALREAQEEVGLPPEAVEILGTLPDYITATSFQVTPVVGLLNALPPVMPNPHEVEAVFQVPLSFLMNPNHHRRHRWALAPDDVREWYSMPYHDGQREWFIWGATAGMLRNLYHFLSA